MQKHRNRKHALLSASGANRWINCTPSAVAEDKYSRSGESVYAEEGTVAHELAEILCRQRLYDDPCKEQMRAVKASQYYTEDMYDYVSGYADYVLAVAAERDNAKHLIEEKLDFNHIVPNGFGTGDNVILSDGALDVIDLKFGQGVVVEADNNDQLKLYAVGAILRYDLAYDLERVTLHIYQPRVSNYSKWSIDKEALLAWAYNIVKPAAQLAYEGLGDKQVGSWCKFCKIKPICRKHGERMLLVAESEFSAPATYSNEELSELHTQFEMLTDWISSVKSYMYEEALNGSNFQGLKLVEGRSNRMITDTGKVAGVILDHGLVPEESLWETTFKTAGKIEKLVGKSFVKDFLSEYIIKPAGKPVLVAASDKRVEINSLERATKDFED